ncbi:hypothetical protein [Modestobacter sp. Leaf380]|uniref:hypothetical protein n=1 Tax=Modestobacter sp. Leaf380 TaxID=1736356 RepID=UPI0006F67347|nr:hypothetical protein [Modestobacter sp. Leaf380]KQS65822.1 hypothetical protein ASG41_14710 [Modestobacter sp. Leaf380]
MEQSNEVGRPTRAQVRARWRDLAAGRCARWEAATWAECQLDDGLADEELVIQGLLFLQSIDLVPGDSDGPVHSGDPKAPFFVATADIDPALGAWETELRRYDADPDAWMRGYFRRMLSGYAATHGVEAARTFGGKLVASGDLAAEDVTAALDGQPTG